jgi:hypothetical protein
MPFGRNEIVCVVNGRRGAPLHAALVVRGGDRADERSAPLLVLL